MTFERNILNLDQGYQSLYCSQVTGVLKERNMYQPLTIDFWHMKK